MCFHPDRCDVLSVTKSKRKYYHVLHGQMLKSVNSTHYLGVTLTSDTTWDTSTSPTRQAGPWVLGRTLKIGSSLVKGSCHISPGICKLYLGPKQHQADQPPRVCTAKGSMVDTAEMLQDIQCQQHAGNAGLTVSPTQAQESKTGELL